jgi:hypothetical protein
MKIDMRYVIIGGASAGSLLVGALLGYSIGVKKTLAVCVETMEKELDESKKHFEEKAETEIARNTARFNEMLKEKAIPTAAELIPESEPAAREALTKYQGNVTSMANILQSARKFKEETPEPEPGEKLFDGKPPYVITLDQFAVTDYDQVTLTYHVPDDMLVKLDGNEFQGNLNSIVGRKNLDKFGENSGDANCVYIRNEPLEIDIELIRDVGPYLPEEKDEPAAG